MFSLNDEIGKFQKLAMTLKDDTMAIDQKFLGGGIAMKDLIQQNSFIMSEMRKMKEVFLNYCKLNDKIYKKIIQHEMSAKDHQQKLGSIIPIIDRKFEYFTIEVSKLKEITVKEVSTNREMIEEVAEGIDLKIAGRVAEEGFDLRIRKLFDIFEEEDMSSSEGCLTDNQGRLIIPKGHSKSRKKKGGYSFEQIQYIARMQVSGVKSDLEKKIEQNKFNIEEKDREIKTMLGRVKKMDQAIEWLGQDLVEVNKLIQNYKKKTQQQQDEIVRQLHEKINDRVWYLKFEEFSERQMKTALQRVRNEFIHSLKILKEDIDSIEPKLQKIHIKFGEHAKKDCEIEKQLGKTIKIIAQNEEKGANMGRILDKKIQDLLAFSQKIEPSIEKQIHNVQNLIKISVSELKRSIANNVETTKNQVYHQIEKEMGRQTKDMKKNISNLIAKEIQLRSKTKNIYEQLQHTKDIVAKKANYSDLIYGFDQKADRLQIQDLKEKIETEIPSDINHVGIKKGEKSPSQTAMQKYKKNRSISSSDNKNRRTYSKASVSRGATLLNRKSQPDENKTFGKYESIEWDGVDFSQELKTINPGTQRYNKSMRPSTANKTLFLL